MSRMELRLTAYDVMGEVWITGVVVMTSDHPGEVSTPALRWTTSIRGTGESDPAEWTRDSLLGALEAL